jgi:hypothetical protein
MNCRADLGVLEQVILVRHRDQHPDQIHSWVARSGDKADAMTADGQQPRFAMDIPKR